jgi:hypothetical protein
MLPSSHAVCVPDLPTRPTRQPTISPTSLSLSSRTVSMTRRHPLLHRRLPRRSRPPAPIPPPISAAQRWRRHRHHHEAYTLPCLAPLLQSDHAMYMGLHRPRDPAPPLQTSWRPTLLPRPAGRQQAHTARRMLTRPLSMVDKAGLSALSSKAVLGALSRRRRI